MSTVPVTPAPKHPILQNLGALLKSWGPILLGWLISSGIITGPGGTPLPPLPPLPAAGTQPTAAALAQYEKTDIEFHPALMAKHMARLAQFHADMLAG